MRRLSSWATILLLNASAFAFVPTVYQWTGGGGGDWNTTSDWSHITGPGSTFPGAGDEADFASPATTTTVTLTSGSASVGFLLFDFDALMYTINGPDTLIFNNNPNSTSASLQVISNAQTITAPVTLLSTLLVHIANGASLTHSTNNFIGNGHSIEFADTGLFTNNSLMQNFNLFSINNLRFMNSSSGILTQIADLEIGFGANVTNAGQISNATKIAVGDATLTNNSTTATISGTGKFIVENFATLNNTNGALIKDTTQFTLLSGTVNNNGGTITNTSVSGTFEVDGGLLNNGTLSSSGTISKFALFNMTGGDVENGTLSGTTGTINQITTFQQTGGTFNNNPTGVIVNITSYNMMGGTFNNNGIFNPVNVMQTGGTINNFDAINTNTYVISGGVTNNYSNIFNAATVAINGGRLANFGTIVANTTFSIASGTYEVGVRSVADHGVLDASTATLGANLLVDIESGFNVLAGQKVVIINANNPITTRFATAETDNPAIDVRVIYDPNDVALIFAPATPAAFLANELLEPIFSAVDNLNFLIERELVRVRNRFCSCGCPWNLFGGYIGSQGQIKHEDFFELDYSMNGGLIGVDYICNQWGFGAMLAYENFSSDRQRSFNLGRFDIDFVHGDLFATFVPDCFPCLAFEGILGFGYQWWNTHRDVFTGGLSSATVAHGRTNVGEVDLLVGAEYAWSCGCDSMVVPFATLQYIHLGIDRFNEHGADFFNFGFGDRDEDSLRSVLGWRLLGNYTFCNNIIFNPELDFGWEHEYLENGDFTVRPLAVSGFGTRIRNDRLGRNFLIFAADFDFTFCDCWGLEAFYEFEGNSHFHNHTYYVGGNYRF